VGFKAEQAHANVTASTRETGNIPPPTQGLFSYSSLCILLQNQLNVS
jgi:hypothetical protein